MQEERTTKRVFSESVPDLFPTHLRDLAERSNISLNIIKERGYRSVLAKSELANLGFSQTQRNAPGPLIPLQGVEGEVVGYQFRPDHPRVSAKGKPIKYETPKGSSNRLDCHPSCRQSLLALR